jgi:Xaa-Pro aminopeptidase
MTQGWAPRSADVAEWEGAAPRRARRAAIAADFAGQWLVVPNGRAPRRSNDVPYPFRPATDFMWLAGDADQGSVLVIDPSGEAVLYVDERPPLGHPMALLDAARGAVWDGVPEPIEATAVRLGLTTRPIAELEPVLRKATGARAVRSFDPAVDALVADDGQELEKQLARRRIVKDAYEIAQLREAVDAAVQGHETVARALPDAVKHGEPFVEGLFTQVARTRGRAVAYNPICGGGTNSTVLHWFANTGRIGPDDILLLDAGVEGHELYSSDVTRVLPVSGRFSSAQRDVYDVVHAAHLAALAAVKPGATFTDPGVVAQQVIADGLRDLGVMGRPELSGIEPTVGAKRWSLHVISHMLGIDVHDSAVVAEEYLTAPLEAGHVLTIEPGLYFSPYDELAPPQLRGIGVRIEDDVLVTADGYEVLSDALPTASSDVEEWIGGLR